MNKNPLNAPPAQGSVRFYLKSSAVPVLLGLLCFLVYNANLRQIGSGDTLSARYLPLILWHHGTLALDLDARWVAHGHPVRTNQTKPAPADPKVKFFEPFAYWITRTHQNQLASFYPVVTPLLVAPLYYPAVCWLDVHGWEQPHIDRVAELMEKLSASLLASVASVVMYLVLRRDGSRWCLLFALAFAFGTNTWMISSQALWQHGTGELLIALALFLVSVPASPLRLILLGAVCVLMAANRPPDALIGAAIALHSVWSHRRHVLWLSIGALFPLAALLYYNLHFIGNLVGGYATGPASPQKFFGLDWSEGLAGLLLSPGRGLLVFSPFLIFVPVGLFQRLRAPGSRGLAVALGCAVVAQLLLYSLTDWRAGVGWGPRFLTDLLPILVWMLAPAPLVLRPLSRVLLVLAMASAVVFQAIGAFWYTKTSDLLVLAGDLKSMHGAWNPANMQFLVELRHPWARGDLPCDAYGSFDRVGSVLLNGNSGVPRLEPGAELAGWALAGGRSPVDVFLLIDGIVLGATGNFLPRADVNNVMHTLSPSGWRVVANTQGVSPGEHVLQLALRVEPSSHIRIVRERRVFVTPQKLPAGASALPQVTSGSELGAMATRAATAVRDRQAEAGFWLTSYTESLRYEAPRQEMNTFLTSMLIDMLSPVAQLQGLNDVVAKARGHLAAQIESDGLVRYHGLPDGPTIGTLGCLITPDTDDTALAWRITGPSARDPRRQQMLEEIGRYRNENGLYRTWLAPPTKYQNLNPGHDPNPADITIQMHVYLMLRELDPPAAQSLSAALERCSGDVGLWVYYAKAPLIPYLRSAELRQLGCAIPLPAERLTRSENGQEIWGEAARRLAEITAFPHDVKARQAIEILLKQIGSEDFAMIRRSPPLLYHNDLSATVKRFYWSEEFGYALWLRLYQAARAESEQPR